MRPLAPGASFRLKAIDQIYSIEEAPPQAGANAASGNGDGEMRFAGPRAAHENNVALLGDEVAAGKIALQGFITNAFTNKAS